MKWITRERPKIDRIACPWLIRRFIEPTAEIIYVPEAQVKMQAEALGAIPFDVPGVEFTHYENRSTFDYFLQKYDLKDPALHVMAPIIRGADADDHAAAAQAAGLWAIAAGMAFNIKDDYALLEQGMVIYDALYSWAKHLRHEKHTQNASENLLLEVFREYLKKQKGKKSPAWVKELEAMIQDHIDTNLTLSLKEISEELDLNPAYLSREFSKHFDDLSFGEYIRKLRIDKAIQLLETSDSPLSEIAYLTGFSDQSHFTRIFKKFTGKNPSTYRKNVLKSKENTKG
ncbi:chromate resistance protein ChrB domain-containing protein [Runella slithyformis]|uniref:Transcriptional regulator, AraC family n=1 Tax=Runella slithyformis (strain ATCC 29530 / DSM 19594 / LMG 11500 / NCIMB 11436 / LSU 4) TaxID=761193 RepID=A0A7U3ZL14_RUNSL|nr:chromate resistance protein ChrB domain-containing protein [Runella slithyformis]AEI49174.1 transcriptional regulator, AraC family [Runella slithyformis DSM 19594]